MNTDKNKSALNYLIQELSKEHEILNSKLYSYEDKYIRPIEKQSQVRLG